MADDSDKEVARVRLERIERAGSVSVTDLVSMLNSQVNVNLHLMRAIGQLATADIEGFNSSMREALEHSEELREEVKSRIEAMHALIGR